VSVEVRELLDFCRIIFPQGSIFELEKSHKRKICTKASGYQIDEGEGESYSIFAGGFGGQSHPIYSHA
jgi:hypothetical protein